MKKEKKTSRNGVVYFGCEKLGHIGANYPEVQGEEMSDDAANGWKFHAGIVSHSHDQRFILDSGARQRMSGPNTSLVACLYQNSLKIS